MQYTNRAGLPKEIVQAITKDRYTDPNDQPSDFSASSLVAPIQQTILKRRYPDKQVVPDVMDLFFLFKGSVGHQVLEDAWHESMGSKVEERLYIQVMGKTISGKFDCYQEGEVRDYKFSKVYKYMKGDFADWEKQLNVYAHLLMAAGHKVNQLTVWMFLEDFKRNEAYKKGYPADPIVRVPLRLWGDSERNCYLESRVRALCLNETLDDDRLLECTDYEMWRGTKDWSIMKKGAKKATKCFDTEEEALTYKLKDGEVLIRRMTKRVRCLEHCSVRTVCKQHKRLLKEEGVQLGEEQQERPIF